MLFFQVHWKYHKHWCVAAKEANSLSCYDFLRSVNVGRRGKVGLKNLGNSCYLNSTLQCLSHIPLLTSYFMSSRSNAHLNVASRDGTGGQLVKEFTSLMCEMWFGSNSVVEPRGLKSQMGRIRPEYSGFEQHDAHEVVEVIIDKVYILQYSQ